MTQDAGAGCVAPVASGDDGNVHGKSLALGSW
jgi:hypothetical protein